MCSAAPHKQPWENTIAMRQTAILTWLISGMRRPLPHSSPSNSHPRLLTQADFMPHRPGHIQEMKPDGTKPFSQFALCPHNPAGIIVVYAALLQAERCISQCPYFSVAVQKPVVFLRFLAFPDTLFTVRMVGIIMVRVHGAHPTRRVHDSDTRMQCIPKQPGVPTWTSDDKARNLLIVQAFVEHEIVDPLRRFLVARVEDTLPEGLLPIRSLEIQGFTNVCIPPAPRHQKTIENFREGLHCCAKVAQEHDIAIDVAEPGVPRDLLCLVVYARQVFGPVPVLRDVFYVLNSKFLTNFRRTCVVANKQNFRIRVDLLPASDGIPLNDVEVTDEGLGSRKECQHRRVPDFFACVVCPSKQCQS